MPAYMQTLESTFAASNLVIFVLLSVCSGIRACVCVRACVRACMRACVRAYARVSLFVTTKHNKCQYVIHVTC